MRVLAVIVGTPLRKVSGATNAGRQLSEATAELVDLDLAIMWDEDRTEQAGRLTTRFVRSTDLLGPLGRFLPRALRTPLFQSAIPALIGRGRYDVVHIHNLIPTFAALRIARAAHRAGVPYVVTTHGFVEIVDYARINGFGRLRSALIHAVLTRPFRRIVADADRLFMLSDRERPLLRSLGVPDERTEVVTNGVNEYFLAEPGRDELDAVRERWPLLETGPVVFFMGSLHGYKGVGTFLRALELIDRPVTAVVAGRFNDPEQPARLLDEAGAPDAVRDRVLFTGGVSDAELRVLHRIADLFVYPTEGDTLPLVVLEAMASGTPVVSTLVGGVPFEVPPEVGVLVEPGDPVAIAGAVSALLADPERVRRMGAAARQRVEHVFRWRLAAEDAVAGYGRMLTADAPRR